jgi:endonuclease/exonuclease/phosphatase family metal-dependent hydrolase
MMQRFDGLQIKNTNTVLVFLIKGVACIQTEMSNHRCCSAILKILTFFIPWLFLLTSCKQLPAENTPMMLEVKAAAAGRVKPCKTEVFTVAFYNVENIFDTEYDGTEYPEYVPGNSSWTREVQLVKVNNIAEVISAIKPDIAGLCEIEDEDALEDLKKGLQRYGVLYKFSTSGCGPTRSATCPMLLSKFPVHNIMVHHVNMPGKSITREILEADVEICNRILKVFVNHWPSKKHPESYRLRTAQVLAARLKALPRECEYILIGDFNSDYDEFQMFSSFKLNDTDGKTGINTILGTTGTQNKSYVSKKDIRDYNSLTHYDPWIDVEENRRMSMVIRGNNQTPDHILIPGTLLDSTGFSYIDKSFTPFTWNGKLLRGRKPYRWQIKWVKNQKIHLGKGYSDHLPVVAAFRMGAFITDTSGSDVSEKRAVEPGLHKKIGKNSCFENSTDGWIACTDDVVVRRDSAGVKEGLFSLSISTPAFKSNRTVARVLLKKKTSGKTLNGLYCKGNGKFSFRIRSRDGQWLYYNAPDFKASKNARYTEVDFRDWVHLKVSGKCPSGQDVELEVRAGKETPLNLWIDEIY